MNSKERLEFDALVDTSATWLTLPKEWRNKFNSIGSGREVNFGRPEKEIVLGEVCGPVKISIEGFRSSFGEVMFVDLEPINGKVINLVGSLQLESSQALLDRVTGRLFPLKSYLLK